MSFQLIKEESSDYSFILLSILIGILFIFIIYPCIMNQNQNEDFKIDQQISEIFTDTNTSQPKTSQPKTSQSNTSQSNTSQSNTSQPNTSQPNTNQPNTNQPNTNQPNTNHLNKIDQKICSKQCCKFVQWPIPFNTRNPNVKDDILDNFIPTNFACNGGENGGCVCLTKDDYNYLSEHGQN